MDASLTLDREARKAQFLNDAGFGAAVRQPLAGDASTRSYERLTLADGSTQVADGTGALGPSVLWGVEVLRFGDGDRPAPGQAAYPGTIDTAPVAATPPATGGGAPTPAATPTSVRPSG